MICTLLCLLCRSASADDAKDDVTNEKRRDPAWYRGRTNPTTALSTLAWVPRITFFPLHLFTEFALRRPLVAFVGWTDRNHVFPIFYKIMNPERRFSWTPLFNLDIGVDLSFGAQAVLRDFPMKRNELQTSAVFGPYTLELKVRDRWQLGPFYVGAGELSSERTRPFYGLGPYSPNVRTNFMIDRLEGSVFGGFESRHFRFEATEGIQRDRLRQSETKPLDAVFRPSDLPGFVDTDLAFAKIDAMADSRRDRDQSGGARIQANATYAQDVHTTSRSFATVEADGEAALEVIKPDRVLSVRAYALDTFQIGSQPVPFMYLATLGGNRHLGFFTGRFRGESAVMAEIRYRYPVAYFGDFQLTGSFGNVFARHFEDFSFGALTTSMAVGIRTRRTGMLPIEVMFGMGTTRFDQPFNVDTVRLYIGTSEGL